MSLSLEFLGCGDAFATGGRFHTCQLVRGNAATVLVDCGASAPVALQQRGLPQSAITHVLVTHLHGDHFGGIPFLLLDAAFNHPRATPLIIAGPPSVASRVLDTLDLLYPGVRARVESDVPVRFVELDERVPCDLGQLTVNAFAVRHYSGAPSYALRVSIDGRTIAYSGDTEWTPTLADVARDADLFVCECFGWDASTPSHLDHALLVSHAGELLCRRLVLTHFGPAMLEHQSEARWDCAYDGMVVELDT